MDIKDHFKKRHHGCEICHEVTHHTLTIASLALIYLVARELHGICKLRKEAVKRLEEHRKK